MKARTLWAFALLGALAACVSAPLPADFVQPRQHPAAEERRFEGVSAEAMQPAVVSVLQDLGFQMSASEPAIGLIVGTRGEEQTAGRIASGFGRYMGEALKNAVTFQWHITPSPYPYLGFSSISAVVTITPAPKATAVRLSLHRLVRHPSGEAIVVWAEEIRAPEAQRDFFAAIDKALAETAAKR